MSEVDALFAKIAVAHTSELVDRAIEIVSGPPFGMHVDEPQFATLKVGAQTAVLRWPRRMGDYPGLDTCEAEIPVALLMMTPTQLRTWKKREIPPR